MASSGCRGYCCSSFARFPDELSAKLPDLKNAIHSVFRRENFPHNSDEDYELLNQPLRLASLLLESDVALPFILRVFDGQVQAGDGTPITLSQFYTENATDRSEKRYAHWDEHLISRTDQHEANTHNKQRVTQLLTAFAEMVKFDVGPLCDKDGENNNLLGYALIDEGPLTKSMQQMFPRGKMSYIWISSSCKDFWSLEGIRGYWRKDPASGQYSIVDDCTARCYCYHDLATAAFKLADILLHEIAHGAWRASVGPCNEIPHTHGTFAENGFEFTSQIFGGLINIRDVKSLLPKRIWRKQCPMGKPRSASDLTAPDTMAVLFKWPNMSQLRSYVPGGMCRYWFNPTSMVEEITRIPLPYVQEVFKEEFWENVRIRGPQSLRPKKVGSWLFSWTPLTHSYSPLDTCTAPGAAQTTAKKDRTWRTEDILKLTDLTRKQLLGKRKRQDSYVGYAEAPPIKLVERFLDNDSRLDWEYEDFWLDYLDCDCTGCYTCDDIESDEGLKVSTDIEDIEIEKADEDDEDGEIESNTEHEGLDLDEMLRSVELAQATGCSLEEWLSQLDLSDCLPRYRQGVLEQCQNIWSLIEECAA